MICVPTSLDQEVGEGLGAQAGEMKLSEVIRDGGFTQVRRGLSAIRYSEQGKRWYSPCSGIHMAKVSGRAMCVTLWTCMGVMIMKRKQDTYRRSKKL